jgi:UPF0716 protein FxsA
VVWFVLFFVVAPLVELYVFIQVSNSIGFLNAVGLAVLSAVVGVWLVKRVGVGLLRRGREELRGTEPPEAAVVDGFLLVLAGILFVLPGFVSDGVAVLLVIPPTRILARKVVLRGFARRRQMIVVSYDRPPSAGPSAYGPVVDTSASEERPTGHPPIELPPAGPTP